MKFCKKPFESMYVKADYVKLCSWMDNDAILGEPLNNSLEELWTSDKAEEVRESIRDGSFKYCNKETCPRCTSGRLDEIECDEGKEYQTEVFPKKMNVSYDMFCNHVCPSCRSDFFVPDQLYKEKMQKLKEAVLPFANKVEVLSTCGMGDCFASPFMMEFLKELRPENPNFYMYFETNGVFADEKHWNEISHLHKYPINFTVTPNSFEKYTYRYLSGGIDDLEKCKKSIKFLSDLRKEGKIDCLKLNMVVQESNYWEIPSFIKYCLEEYNPDLIQIKPLNRWFCLDAEGYWFKNVLNPKHPHHENYLAVMQDPILKHPKVYDWTEMEHERDERYHPSVYSEFYVDILNKLLVDEEALGKIQDKLQDMQIHNVGIYGAWKYGKVCLDILTRIPNIVVKYFIDKRKGRKKGRTYMKYQIKGVYGEDFSEIDTIIISALAAEQEIIRDLYKVGYKGNVITIKDLL